VLISDIPLKDVYGDIAKQLNIKHLSECEKELDNVNGIVFGVYNRLFGVMTIKMRGKAKNAIFLVDTGAPRTYISDDLLQSYKMSITDETELLLIELNKRQIMVGMSPFRSNHRDLNILGTDYLRLYRAQLYANFETKVFNIKLKYGKASNENYED
jgi:hypothetical protein